MWNCLWHQNCNNQFCYVVILNNLHELVQKEGRTKMKMSIKLWNRRGTANTDKKKQDKEKFKIIVIVVRERKGCEIDDLTCPNKENVWACMQILFRFYLIHFKFPKTPSIWIKLYHIINYRKRNHNLSISYYFETLKWLAVYVV